MLWLELNSSVSNNTLFQKKTYKVSSESTIGGNCIVFTVLFWDTALQKKKIPDNRTAIELLLVLVCSASGPCYLNGISEGNGGPIESIKTESSQLAVLLPWHQGFQTYIRRNTMKVCVINTLHSPPTVLSDDTYWSPCLKHSRFKWQNTSLALPNLAEISKKHSYAVFLYLPSYDDFFYFFLFLNSGHNKSLNKLKVLCKGKKSAAN